MEDNKDIFAEEISDLCSSSTIRHYIDTKDAKPIKQAQRRLAFHLQKEIKTTLEELISTGIIVPSESDWASNIVPVRKRDGSIRICVDYRKLNNVTIKDCYSIPRIEDLFDRFHGI